jgi:hypothetical protein
MVGRAQRAHQFRLESRLDADDVKVVVQFAEA